MAFGPEATESGRTTLGFGRDELPFSWIGDKERVGEGTYAAFVLDPDGVNVEAVCHAPG